MLGLFQGEIVNRNEAGKAPMTWGKNPNQMLIIYLEIRRAQLLHFFFSFLYLMKISYYGSFP